MNLYRITLVYVYGSKSSLFGVSELKPVLHLHKFQVNKETPCGYWFTDLNYKERWVSKNSRIAYAYVKIQDARRNFIKRSEKREMILTEQLEKTKKGLELVKTFYNQKKKNERQNSH